MPRRSPLCVLPTLLLISCLAHGQNPPASPLEELRANPDREKLAAWITNRVQTIATNAPTAGQAAHELRSEYTGPEAFRTQYAQVTIEQVRTKLRDAKGPGAARLITVLSALAEAPVADVSAPLLEALAHADPAVRAAAAAGLRALRSKLTGPAFSAAVSALREAARKETSGGALKMEYLALDFSDVPAADQRAAADALLDVLDARARQYTATGGDGADSYGLRTALALRNQLDDAGRRRLVGAAGRMLKASVARYADGERPLMNVKDDGPVPLVAARDGAELVIEEAERVIRELLGATTGPNVSNGMRRGRADEMNTEMARWTEQIKESTGVDLASSGG